MAILKFLWLAIRPISKAESTYGWYELMNLIPPIVYGVVPFLTKWANNIDFIWFVSIPAFLFLVAGIKLQRRIDRYNKREVELVFDPEIYPSCKMREERKPNVWTTIYRVGLRVKGKKTVSARIQLARFTPQNAPFLPQPLNPKDIPQTGQGWVTINPGQPPTEFINIVEWTPGEDIAICYHREKDNQRTWPNGITPRNYTFTLLVEVKDSSSSEVDFMVDMENGDLVFKRI